MRAADRRNESPGAGPGLDGETTGAGGRVNLPSVYPTCFGELRFPAVPGTDACRLTLQ